MSSHRIASKIINESIATLNLDLSGKTILTEAGTNYYLYTPIIPSLAGAKKVIAWTRDSAYASAEDIEASLNRLCKSAGLKNIIVRKNSFNPDDIEESHLITNSGHLRPLNEKFLCHAKNAVIPLMYESWELRKEDIDIKYCFKKKIKVAGTNEGHPKIRVFDFVGPLLAKMILESGHEILRNKILIWSEDNFGETAGSYLRRMGAKIYQTKNTAEAKRIIKEISVIVLCDYKETRTYSGQNGIFNWEKIALLNPALTIIHLYGEINYREVMRTGLNIFPLQDGAAKKMSRTLGYVGPMPILNLLTAGFKVGELMLKNRTSSLMQPITF